METQSTTTTPKRLTPTQRQIAKLSQMSPDELISKATEALRCLNRRAKKIRDDRSEYRRASFSTTLALQIAKIYNIKNKYLAAMIRAGRASVYTFEREANGMVCTCCGKTWGGDSEYCYTCVSGAWSTFLKCCAGDAIVAG